jgi:hypothetical protein
MFLQNVQSFGPEDIPVKKPNSSAYIIPLLSLEEITSIPARTLKYELNLRKADESKLRIILLSSLLFSWIHNKL